MRVSPRPRPRGREPHAAGSSPAWTQSRAGRQPGGLDRNLPHPRHGWPPSLTRSGNTEPGLLGAWRVPTVRASKRDHQPPHQAAADDSHVLAIPTHHAGLPLLDTLSPTHRLRRTPSGAGALCGSRGARGTCRSAWTRAPVSAFLRKRSPASRLRAAPRPWTPPQTARPAARRPDAPTPVRRVGALGGDELTEADPTMGLGPSHMGRRSGARLHHVRTQRRALGQAGKAALSRGQGPEP